MDIFLSLFTAVTFSQIFMTQDKDCFAAVRRGKVVTGC
jgi:hypothetical protein